MMETNNAQGPRKTRIGRVLSDKMHKTIVVRVERVVQHPLLKKYVRRHKKLYAHDEANAAKVGDVVRVTECHPLSKLKRWRLAAIVEKAK
jgi:small subunit ribosomal protein S17